ncbi:hypothetical protein GCM10027417_01610 [Glutamicibacter endophyticus]
MEIKFHVKFFAPRRNLDLTPFVRTSVYALLVGLAATAKAREAFEDFLGATSNLLQSTAHATPQLVCRSG